ncbi:MAG: LOG family protein [Aggregatilineales bacterium]
MQRVCIFCGSSNGAREAYNTAARTIGTSLAKRGLGLVYGGGRVGLMGTVADAALAAGGQVIGVIPQSLVDKEVGHHSLTELRIVHSMHERKALMVDLSDAFIAMPGGAGTMDEFFEIFTWAQLGFHRKPCALLNVAGYYDPLLAFMDHAVQEGFIRVEHRDLIRVDDEPDRLLDTLATYTPPLVDKWRDRSAQ